MDFKKFLTIGIAVSIAANAIDFVVQGKLLGSFYAQAPFRQDMNFAWLIVGDIVAAFVFTWFYLAVAGSFASGVSGGATMGFYTGVLVNFPAAIFMHLMIQGIPYYLAWIWIFYGVFWYVCAGAIAGALNKQQVVG
jgi:hypothetical protein